MNPPDRTMVWSLRTRILLAVALLVLAALPRFYHLGDLSFYADEDFTALAARAVAGPVPTLTPELPSGLPYRRGLPLTWVNAELFRHLKNEAVAYRVPSAVFGTLTPPAVFLTGSAFISPPGALVAGALLALSEWHVAFSRIARMYAPFMLFYLLAAFFFWKWTRKGGWVRLVLALLTFYATVSLHLLGLTAIQFALIPLVLPGVATGPPWLLVVLVTGVASGLFFGLDRILVRGPYDRWSLPGDYRLEGVSEVTGGGSFSIAPEVALLVAVGVFLGVWLGMRTLRSKRPYGASPRPLRGLALIVAGGAAGGFALAGQLWGVFLSLLVLTLMTRGGVVTTARRGGLPLVLILLGGAVWVGFAFATEGLYEGIRQIGSFPFPYLALLWSQFPGLVAVFAFGTLWLALHPSHPHREGLLSLVLAVILPMTVIGMASRWGGTRYLLNLYPFMLLAVGGFLVHGLRTLVDYVRYSDGEGVPLVLALIVAFSGATGGHGVFHAAHAASLHHGEPVNQLIHMYPFRPDHQRPGKFVRERLGPGDVVVAEDPMMQAVYAGQVDYWYRKAGEAQRFLYLDPRGEPRDIYVASKLLPNPESVERVVSSAPGRVWFVTSGETAPDREWYLSPDQRRWLDSIETHLTPEHLGRDGVTAVYCLNCGSRPVDSESRVVPSDTSSPGSPSRR